MAAAPNPLPRLASEPKGKDARALMLGQAANELVFAVVGHVGSGTSKIANTFLDRLRDEDLPGGPFDVEIIKASSDIKSWALENGESIPSRESASLDYTSRLQDLGDRMRSAPTTSGEDHSGAPWHLRKDSYVQLEARLEKEPQ